MEKRVCLMASSAERESEPQDLCAHIPSLPGEKLEFASFPTVAPRRFAAAGVSRRRVQLTAIRRVGMGSFMKNDIPPEPLMEFVPKRWE